MKTFTNLAHRAFKKCASLGTTNRNRYYLFSIIMLLTLGVGNAWGEDVTETITMKGFAGITSAGYQNFTKTGSSDKGTAMVAYAFNGQIGQVRGNKNTVAGASVAIEDKTSNWSLYNSQAMGGAIKAIKVTQTATGTNFFQNNLFVSLGTSAQGEVTAVTNAQKQDAGGTAQEINFTIDPSKGYTYFKLLSNEQFAKGTITNVVVTVTYETAGGGETPDPEPDPTQYTIKWHTAKGVTTDVTLNEGATITKPETDPTMTGYVFMGWTASCDVASDGADFTALTDFGTADSDKDFYAVFAVAATTGGGESTPTEITDVLNRETTGVTGTSYTTWTEKTASSSAIYAGQSAGGNSSIQLRSEKSNSGIVTTASGGKATKISVVWNSNTTSGRTIDIYGKNSAYTVATDLYDTSKQGTKLGNIKYETSTELAISGDYEYIGIRSNSGALYLTSVSITWASEGTGGGTTTYDNYITTCASGIEYVELGDDFKWSATEAEVTIDATNNVFPTLTNTHNVPVTYSSSDETIASIAADGTVTLNKEGSVTITAKYEGGTSAGTGKEYKAKTVTYSLKVNKAAPVASGTTYVKVTSTAGITDGEYLIVYETGKVAFDGSLATLDAISNTIDVEITDGKIAGTNYIDLSTFTIDATAGTIKSASGYYIGQTSDANGLKANISSEYENALSIENDGTATIKSGGAYLRYNSDANNWRFRYYKSASYSGQKAIALYKKASKHTVTIANCTNGSVSAKMGETALATDDQVLSGTQITLSNEAATGYKLTAYDVYKTGDATAKVTVTDGKFIMPEFDVTISATFELAKTLTGIEITNAATQTIFWQTETFNHDGLKVTAHFDGAADEDVTGKVTVTGSTATAGSQTVTVSYAEGTTTKTTTYTINVKAIPNTKETAYTVADAFDIIDKLTTADGVFIKGIVSQVDSYNETYKSITYWISDDGTTTKQLQAYSGKGLEGADFVDINGVSVEDQVIVCGDLKKHTDGTYEFNYNNYLVSQIKTTKADPELSYTTTEYNVNLGEAFTAPTLNNTHNLTVTYSSNNEDVATVAVDGAVTIKAAGTVTITASFAGDEDYVAGSASYTINITDPNVSEATFVAGTDKSDTESISKNGITVEFTNGSFSRDDNYRCYVGQSMTISYADGNITKIVLECTTNNDAEYGPGQFTTETATYSYSGKVGTWTGEANSVTFTAGTQVRMTTITVYYKQDTRTPAGIAWNPATVSLTVGDAFTAPTLSNPNELTGITFTSDNEALATVTDAGVISLVSGKTGTATITATFADGHADYKPAEATCVITVSPKSEKVVILAEYNGQWYALKAAYLSGKTDRLDAVPVNYVGGKLYNVAEADKASIEWSSVVEGDKVSFLNDGKYLKGKTSTTLLFEEDADGLYQWDNTTYTMTIGTTVRSFLYNGEAFRNFAVLNAGKVVNDVLYSSLPVVTAPVYATGDAYGRSVNLGEDGYRYGTICLPFGSTNYTGATFYEFVGSETGKVYLGSVTTLEAGVPYIFEARATEVAVYGNGTTAANPGRKNGLVGTFTNDTEVAVGNYILLNNELRQAAAICYVNANRAYVVMNDVPSGAPQQMPGRRYIGMSVQGENEATGFENITAPEGQAIKVIENGQLIIIRDGVKYNVQGQVIK